MLWRYSASPTFAVILAALILAVVLALMTANATFKTYFKWETTAVSVGLLKGGCCQHMAAGANPWHMSSALATSVSALRMMSQLRAECF